MTDQIHPDPQDDVEAHMPFKYRRDEEVPAEKPTGAEPAANEDVAATGTGSPDDDVEAHGRRYPS